MIAPNRRRAWYSETPFFAVPLALMRAPKSTLNDADKAVYVALASFADNWTGECFPSYGTLMEVFGSKTTISKCLRRLTESGWITVERRKTKGGWRNHYFLKSSPEPQAAPSVAPRKRKPSERERREFEERCRQDLQSRGYDVYAADEDYDD